MAMCIEIMHYLVTYHMKIYSASIFINSVLEIDLKIIYRIKNVY